LIGSQMLTGPKLRHVLLLHVCHNIDLFIANCRTQDVAHIGLHYRGEGVVAILNNDLFTQEISHGAVSRSSVSYC